MKPRINKKLNLVITIDDASGAKIHVHSTPISREVFETFYEELGLVFTKSFGESGSVHMAISAPQLAYPALKKLCDERGTWDTVKSGLVNEILRLTNVIYLSDAGWVSVPLEVAIKEEVIDEDSEREVLSSLIFFTAITFVAPKQLVKGFLDMASALRNWGVTSSNSTEYKLGLPISTDTEISETITSSRVPLAT
jgi:hypothetical protein